MSWDWVKILKEEMLDLRPDERLSRHAATDRLAWVSTQSSPRQEEQEDTGPGWSASDQTPGGGAAPLLGWMNEEDPAQQQPEAWAAAAPAQPAPPPPLAAIPLTAPPLAAPPLAVPPLTVRPPVPSPYPPEAYLPSRQPQTPYPAEPASSYASPQPAAPAPPATPSGPVPSMEDALMLVLRVDGALAGAALPSTEEVYAGRERASTLVVPEGKHTISRRAVAFVRSGRRTVDAVVHNRNGAWVTRTLPEGTQKVFIESGNRVSMRTGERLALDPAGTVVISVGESQ